jgi:hypothetical protein
MHVDMPMGIHTHTSREHPTASQIALADKAVPIYAPTTGSPDNFNAAPDTYQGGD